MMFTIALLPLLFAQEVTITQLDDAQLSTYLENGELLQPVWVPCAQSSETSYLNFTFSPYPLVRQQMANISLTGFINEAIYPGTKIKLTSRNADFAAIPGPSVEIDVCDVIKKQFPDAPYPVECPLSQSATLLVLNNIRQRQQNAASAPSSDSGIGAQFKVPFFAATGLYLTKLTLEGPEGSSITCAQTILRIK